MKILTDYYYFGRWGVKYGFVKYNCSYFSLEKAPLLKDFPSDKGILTSNLKGKNVLSGFHLTVQQIDLSFKDIS